MKPKYGEGCVPLPPGTQPTVVDAEGNRHAPAERPPEPTRRCPHPLFEMNCPECQYVMGYRAGALQPEIVLRAGGAERQDPPEAGQQAIGLIRSAAADLPSDAVGGPSTQFKLALAIEAIGALRAGGPAREEPLEVLRLVVNLEADLAEYEKLAKQAYGPDTTAHAFRRAIEAARRALSSGLPAPEEG